MPINMILLAFFYIVCSTFGVVCVKLGASTTSISFRDNVLALNLNPFSILGIVLYISGFLLWMVLLQKYKMSYIIPIMSGVSYITVMLSAFFIVKETVTTSQLIGIAVILVGIILMNI